MSFETWKAEFMPVENDHPSVQQNDVTRLMHSLQKWRGLTLENMQKHGVFMSHGLLQDGCGARRSVTSGNSCALCDAHYLSEGTGDEGQNISNCYDCPLTHNGKCCERPGSPWTKSMFADADGGFDATPMIEALESTLQKERNK